MNSNNNSDKFMENFDVNGYFNHKDSENINYTELSNKFWNKISFTLNQINFGKVFINPTKDFPNFIKSLYSIKDQLDPVTRYINSKSDQNQIFNIKSCIKGIIKLISTYSMKSDPNFIIWDLPEALYNNNFIYFSLLLELNDTQNSIWVNFSKTAGSLNLFLDHFLPLIGPSNDSATTQLILIVDSIFRTPEYYEEIRKPKKNANFFWFKLMRIIGCCKNDETVITAFSISKSIFLQLSQFINIKAKNELINNLIDASSNGTTNTYREFYKITSDYEKDIEFKNKFQNRVFYKEKQIDEDAKKAVFYYRYCPIHYQSLEFIFNLNLTNFKYMTLCKKLIHQGIRSPNDLFYIQKCLLVQKTKKPLLGFRFLLTVATSDKIWSSLATKMIYDPLLRFSKYDDVQSLFCQFIKKAFIFVGVTTIKNKYSRRRMMILTVFKDMYKDLELEWLKSTITKYYASLVFTKKIDHIIPEISLINSNKKKDKIKKKSAISKSSYKTKRNNDDNSYSSESIKESRSVQSFDSIHSELDSISSSNSVMEFPRNQITPKSNERVQFDKNLPIEIDQLAKSQIDMKNYLKFSKSSDGKFSVDIKPKSLNKKIQLKQTNQGPYQKLTPQQKKLLIEKQKFNERLNLQRKRMLLNFQQQKEKRIPNSPKIQRVNKKPEVPQPCLFLHIKKVPPTAPQSQMNQLRKPPNFKSRIPTLIHPSKMRIQQQQQKKLKQIEIQQIEPIDGSMEKCQNQDIKEKESEEEEEIETRVEAISDDENDDEDEDETQNQFNIDHDDIFKRTFSSDDLGENIFTPYDDDNDSNNNNDDDYEIDDNNEDDDNVNLNVNDNNANFIDSENIKSSIDSPPLSPSASASISSHGSKLVVPKIKRK